MIWILVTDYLLSTSFEGCFAVLHSLCSLLSSGQIGSVQDYQVPFDNRVGNEED